MKRFSRSGSCSRAASLLRRIGLKLRLAKHWQAFDDPDTEDSGREERVRAAAVKAVGQCHLRCGLGVHARNPVFSHCGHAPCCSGLAMGDLFVRLGHKYAVGQWFSTGWYCTAPLPRPPPRPGSAASRSYCIVPVGVRHVHLLGQCWYVS